MNADKILLCVNSSIVLYFITLYALYHFQIDIVLVGVFIELLTIPFLMAQIIFVVIGMKYWKDQRITNVGTKVSIGVLSVCTLCTIGSLF